MSHTSDETEVGEPAYQQQLIEALEKINDSLYNNQFQKQPLPKFSGGDSSFDIEDWLTQFEANYVRLDDRNKIYQLRIHLRGAAAEWYDLRDKKNAFSFNEVKEELTQRYLKYDPHLLRNELNNFKQNGKNVLDYIIMVEKLCSRVCKSMTEKEKISYITRGIGSLRPSSRNPTWRNTIRLETLKWFHKGKNRRA